MVLDFFGKPFGSSRNIHHLSTLLSFLFLRRNKRFDSIDHLHRLSHRNRGFSRDCRHDHRLRNLAEPLQEI